MGTEERTERSVRLDSVIRDLGRLRARGVDRVAVLDLPDLAMCVARLAGRDDQALEAHHYELVLGDAIDELGDGDAAELASMLFGLAPHVRGLHPIELRKRAAEAAYDRPPEASTVDAFRKSREPRILAALATTLLKGAAPSPHRIDRIGHDNGETTASASLRTTTAGWRPRTMPVLTIQAEPPGRIRELTWDEFGDGIDQLRGQLRDYGTTLDVDLAVGINEGGLLMATLLASAAFGRCAIGYVRTVRRGDTVTVDARHTNLGHRLASADAVMLCDFEVKATPVLDTVRRYLVSQGLRPGAPTFLSVMGALATSGPTLPAEQDYDSRNLPCAPALGAAPLADLFVGYLMPSPGIDPPLGLP